MAQPDPLEARANIAVAPSGIDPCSRAPQPLVSFSLSEATRNELVSVMNDSVRSLGAESSQDAAEGRAEIELGGIDIDDLSRYPDAAVELDDADDVGCLPSKAFGGNVQNRPRDEHALIGQRDRFEGFAPATRTNESRGKGDLPARQAAGCFETVPLRDFSRVLGGGHQTASRM